MAQGIDFNPKPRTNFIDAIQGGLQQGLGLGLQAQQLQANRLALEQAKRQQELEKQKLDQEQKAKKFSALNDFVSKPYFKSLAKKEKSDMMSQYISATNDYLGTSFDTNIDLPDSLISTYSKRVSDILKSDLPSDRKRVSIGSILSEASSELEKDQFTALKDSADFGIPSGVDQSKINDDTMKLRKEFQGNVKEFETIVSRAKQMRDMLNNAKNGKFESNVAVDQALISIFNKINDPTSVVRESEYARTPENLSLINRFLGVVQKQGLGGAGLTDKDRIDLVRGALSIAESSSKSFQVKKDFYSNLASRSGFSPEDVVGGIDFKPGDFDFNSPEKTKKTQMQNRFGTQSNATGSGRVKTADDFFSKNEDLLPGGE